MNKYLKTTGTFIGVWFIASLVNGLLSGTGIAILCSSSVNEAMGSFFLSFVLSFVFSVPLVVLVWLVTIAGQVNNKKGDSLFQLVLQASLFTSVAAAIIFINTIGKEFLLARYVTGLCIITSAFISVLFFRKNIKANV